MRVHVLANHLQAALPLRSSVDAPAHQAVSARAQDLIDPIITPYRLLLLLASRRFPLESVQGLAGHTPLERLQRFKATEDIVRIAGDLRLSRILPDFK